MNTTGVANPDSVYPDPDPGSDESGILDSCL
jgi:hypothetical protein